MTLSIRDAELLVTDPATSTSGVADFRVPASDIEHASVEERAGREVAQGQIRIDNSDKAYTSGDFPINFDDKLDFRVAWEGASTGVAFGTDPFGEQPFGDTTWTVSSTLVVTDWTVSGQQWHSTLELDVEHFVFNRLKERHVNDYAELSAPISGSSDAHLDTILADYVPDVGTSQLPTISETIDYSVDRKSARKVVAELARLAHDATGNSWLVGADATDLTVTKLEDLTPQWTAGVSADQTDFKGDISHSADAGDLVNQVRVKGGVDPDNVEDKQETQSSTATVTESTRKTVRVDPRKPTLPKVEVYAQEKSSSDDELRVRFQSDDGSGNPIEPGNTDSDIVNQSKTVPEGHDDWLTFQLGEYTFAPRERPHLIVDATGPDGQDVGTDGSGNVTFRTHFSKPVIVSVRDGVSQNEFRRHDDTISDENLRTFDAARDRGRAEVDRRGMPKLTFGPASCDSRRAHELSIADAVTLDYPWLRADDDYVVTQVSHTYAGSTLESEVELRSIERFA